MPMYTHDMGKVQKWGELVPEGWYHVKIQKGEEKNSDNTPGEKVWWYHCRIQQEPLVGALIMINCSLQAHALATLKAIYEACGYSPGPEGHDPETVVGGEMLVKVEHQIYKGEQRAKVAPYNIRSLTEGVPGGH